MGGGLMQLVAYGAQDIYLTGNPQITFFKVVYRRHTNFSIEAIQQTFEGGISDFKDGGRNDVIISRNGDLLYKIWLEAELTYGNVISNNTYSNWTNNTGHALIEECVIDIGGQQMDKQDSHWLDIWNELTDHEESEWYGLNKHAAKNAYLKSNKLDEDDTKLKLYIPLKFWFCRNVGLALPLIALQYHEVKLNFKFRNIYGLINADTSTFIKTPNDKLKTDIKIYGDYIFLDTDERRKFAQISHEYLIEQVQYSNNKSKTDIRIDFNHPIKELFWIMPKNEYTVSATVNLNKSIDTTVDSHNNDYFNYNSKLDGVYIENISGQNSYEGFDKCTIRLNGHTRFVKRDASYFRICQPQQAGHKIPTKHIYMYSFALNPEEHQPSGTCNFSRLDNVKLIFDNMNDPDEHNIKVYSLNYNVLRIMSGMGGLAYSN
jgi:hypothetical protein